MKLNWWGEDQVTQRCVNVKTYHDFHFKNDLSFYGAFAVDLTFDKFDKLRSSTPASLGLPTWRGYQADFNGRYVADQTTRSSSIAFYIITQVILPFWLVLAYDLLEDRRTIDVISKFFPLCFKMAESFKNLDNILQDWAKDKVQESLVQVLNRYQKHSLAGRRKIKPFLF